MSLRIIFAGTPEFAATSLGRLMQSEHSIVAVYTQPDRPAGRGRKLTPSPVKQLALEHELPICQPLHFKEEETLTELALWQSDLMVVVAYGLLLPLKVLDTPRLGCINVHASLLPRWRGAAPIQRAIEAGDRETGITLMQMDRGLDTGDMLLTARCPIEPRDSAATLEDRLAILGGETLVRGLRDLEQGKLQPSRQNPDLACYAKKLTKDEGQIDWHRSSGEIDRQIRALNRSPVAFTLLDQQRVRVWEGVPDLSRHNTAPGTILRADQEGIVVSCGDGQLMLTQLQLDGGKVLPAGALMNARSDWFQPGKRFAVPNTSGHPL